MDIGTYVTTSGGMLQFQKLDILNNNLANINTPGFKRQMLVTGERTFDQTLAATVNLGDPYAQLDYNQTPQVMTPTSYTDFSLGPIRATGNPLDAALSNPKDFFVVAGPDGPQYTRAGSFTLNQEGALVTMDGAEVQGDGGALSVGAGTAAISSNGTVTSNGREVGKLRIVRINDPSTLERIGATRFKMPGGGEGESVDGDLVPGALEMSNVSAISSMVDLVATNRAFQLYEKSAQAIDELNGTAIQTIGRTVR